MSQRSSRCTMLPWISLTLLLSSPLTACSPLQDTVKSLTEAQAVTTQIDKELEQVLNNSDNQVLVLEHGKRAKDLNEEVHDGISRALVKTSQLQDKPNEWLKALTLWGGVALATALCVLLIYIGVGRLSRPILGKIGSWFASPTEKGNAKLAKEAIQDPAKVDSLVTALRTDPKFNELYKKADK